jgi:predicted phosphodiesterase
LTNRFAVISDVHGNRWALEAVLDDIDQQGIAAVINLGDLLYGPLDPLATADILVERGYPTVRGNEDRIITDRDVSISDTLAFVRKQLRSAHIEWLRSLPPVIVSGDACACHGSPTSDTDYLRWEVNHAGARRRTAADVDASLDEIESSLILCGHDHVPATMPLPGGRTVVNPGSVGLPAYTDDHPYPHVMETGTPHARYAVVARAEDGWSVSDRSVPYDWEAAAGAAQRNGRADWAAWLRTGRAGDR